MEEVRPDEGEIDIPRAARTAATDFAAGNPLNTVGACRGPRMAALSPREASHPVDVG